MARGMNQEQGRRMMVEPRIIEFLRTQVGEVVTLEDLIDHLPDGAKESSVRSVMRRLVEGDTMDVIVISRGNSWRVDSLSKPRAKEAELKTMVGPLEILGKMEGGAELARDNASGKLYTLRAL